MAYTPITGNDGSLTVGSTTVAALRNWTVEISADTIETTTMGNDFRKYISGLSSWTGSADIYFDAAESTASIFSLTGVAVGTDPIVGKFYVRDGAGSTDVAYTGTVLVTGYSVTSNMDGLVEASISMQGSGALAFSNNASV
jgi:predicted secreted protein